MASAELLEFSKLLAPISGDNPCGESLRWDPVWDEISALRKARTDAVSETDDVEADWAKVQEVASGALEQRSKDLMIAGWLAEALVHTNGFAGLRDGLRLIRELLETFWDGLHPTIDEDGDLEARAAPLVWLADPFGGARMPALIREIPLARVGPDQEVFSQAYLAVRSEDGAAKRERFDAAVSATPRDFYLTLYEDIQQGRSELERLASLADEKFGEAAPGWKGLRDAVAEVEVIVRRILRDKGGLPEEAEEADAEETPEDGGEPTLQGNGSAAAAQGPIRSRSDAIARLEEAANYLKRTEPHSPVSYLVQRAVTWARMPFEEVMKDLVKDEQILGKIDDTLGLRNQQQNEED